MNVTTWKVKNANMFVMSIIWCKIPKKITVNYNFLKKINLSKGLYLPCPKCMDKFLEPCFDILMNWASYFENPHEKFTKLLSLICKISRKKSVTYLTLITFFHTGKLVSSRVFVETWYSEGFYMLYIPNFMKSWVTVQIEYCC